MTLTGLLVELKKRLYIYVLLDMTLAILIGTQVDIPRNTLRLAGWLSVFIMLYPMLTGMNVEKVGKAVMRPWLTGLSLAYAFLVASLTAYVVSHTILIGYPEIAFALAMVGAIPCSNMLIGWTGIAEASVEDALVVAVSGLLLIPLVSPILLSLVGGVFVEFSPAALAVILATYIAVPLVLGMATRRLLVKRLGMEGFMKIKPLFPGVSALGVLLIVFIASARVANLVISNPSIIAVVSGGLLAYYAVQTIIALATIRVFKIKYKYAIIVLLASVASSQAISLSVAATMFPSLTVFALSMKPLLQVLYILFLVYTIAPVLRAWSNSRNPESVTSGSD